MLSGTEWDIPAEELKFHFPGGGSKFGSINVNQGTLVTNEGGVDCRQDVLHIASSRSVEFLDNRVFSYSKF